MSNCDLAVPLLLSDVTKQPFIEGKHSVQIAIGTASIMAPPNRKGSVIVSLAHLREFQMLRCLYSKLATCTK